MFTHFNLQHTSSKREGAGVKYRLNNVKKTALLVEDGFTKSIPAQRWWSQCSGGKCHIKVSCECGDMISSLEIGFDPAGGDSDCQRSFPRPLDLTGLQSFFSSGRQIEDNSFRHIVRYYYWHFVRTARICTRHFVRTKIHNFDKISQFWPKFTNSTKTHNLVQNSHFQPKFTFLTKIHNFDQISHFDQKSQFWPNFTFSTKIHNYDQNRPAG